MNQILEIYKKVLAVFKDKPLKLWGLSLLAVLLEGIGVVLSGPVLFVGLAVTFLLDVAVALIYLRGYRKQNVETSMLFDTFRSWETVKRVTLGMGWMYLWIFIWSLIPIAGIYFGIKKAYAYRLTPYILANEPDVSITDAIKVSEQRTDGFKARMFWSEVLFYVAVILCVLILGSFAAIRFIGWIFGIALFAVILCVAAFKALFLGLLRSAYYEEICGKKAKTEAPRTEEPTPAAEESSDEVPAGFPLEQNAET